MTKRVTARVRTVRVGDRLTSWMGEPVAIERARIDGDWWRVRAERADEPLDLLLAHASDVEAGLGFVPVERA